MRIGLVVDSACDLPKKFIDDNNITILPIAIKADNKLLVDRRDVEETAAFYREQLGSKHKNAETAPYSTEEIKNLFLEKLVIDYDFVFCLTLMTSRSPIHDNAVKASFTILSEYKPIRRQAGVSGPFSLRVIDTQNLFAAQAITAVEAIRMIGQGENPLRIRDRLEQIAPKTYGYMIPRDLYQLRARAQKKGDKSVGWLQYALGSALDIKPIIQGFRGETGPVAKIRHFDEGVAQLFAYACERIRSGLLTPTMSVSYGGDLSELEKLNGYRELETACSDNSVELLTSVMSTTGAINVGDGAVSLGFASEEHELPF